MYLNRVAPIPIALIVCMPIACRHRVDNVVEGSRLVVRSATLPSGEEVAVDLWDTKLRTPCRFVGDTCVPIGAQILYRDGNCTQPLAVKSSANRCNEALGAQSFAVESVAQGCDVKTRVFHLGPDTSAPTVLYQKTASGCSSRGALSVGDSAYALGQALDATELLGSKHVPLTQLDRIGFADKRVATDGTEIDGASLHGDLYDRDLGVPCTAQIASDGRTRCLPTLAPPPALNLFSDAMCESPVLAVSGMACGDPPRYAAEQIHPDMCSVRMQISGVKNQIEDTFTGAGTACSVAPITTDIVTYSLVPSEVTDFAELTAAPALGTERLTVRSFVSADGKRVRFDTLYDTQLALPCAPIALSQELTRCLPTESAQLAYLDEDCRQPIIIHDGCASPTYALQLDSSINDTCSVPSLYQAGDAITAPSMIYAAIAGTCAPAALVPDATYFKATPVMLETFASVTLRDLR